MTNFQAEKQVVRDLHAALAGATPESVGAILATHVSPDWHWRGMHPFHERHGPAEVAAVFWAPLLGAVTRLQRRPDIFLAGSNAIDGGASVWVTQMGHLMGLFDRPWLGIRPTSRIVMLRFVEFNRVVDGRVAETAMFVDIPHLMTQAGQNQLPPETGVTLVQPGPMTHEGLMWGEQPAAAGIATMAAIDAMLHNPAARLDSIDEPTRLRRAWHDDMIWWGPTGIGATYTVDRYNDQHSKPFDAALHDGYRFNGHIAKVAEGNFGGFFGWANLTLKNAGGYMGMTGGGPPADMRVVDMYRRDGDKLAENWVFIDILHYLNMQGLDVLGRLALLEQRY